MSKTKKILIAFLCLLIIIPLGVFGYVKFKLNSVHEETDYMSKIKKVDGITNVLLTGTDARPGETASRTDSMMILTIDNVNKSIKLTSLARDTYVQLPGRPAGKLNAAYFWGQEPMLFQTIEDNFGVGLDKIVQVDFNALMSIVDSLGGVEVDIPENNIAEINKYAKESYKMYNSSDKSKFKKITSPGKQILNGYQALSFARVRKVDSAISRDKRQQEVLKAIAKKMETIPATKYPTLLNSLLPYVKTNLSSNEILSLGVTALGILKDNDNKIKTANFPITDDEIHSKGGIYKNAGWVWLYDLNSTVVLRDFIYKDIDFKDNDYLKDNSNVQLNY
ncbi:LCP family protein [Terrisporobacter sp.]